MSFDNRKDALGLELLEGLYEVTQKKGFKNFDLIIRISSERQGTRWDEDFIKRQFQIHQDVQHAWICGPPVMNEVFDRSIESLRNEGFLKLPKSKVEIL